MSVKETLKNNPATTLSAAITDTTGTSVSVTDGSVFPSSGQFRIIVDSEIMLVTARATNTLTVVRGSEGSTAATHSSGAAITQILTAGAMQRYGRDNDPHFDSNRPPYRIINSSGTVLTKADFTTINLSTSTITDDSSGAITIRKAGNSAVGENLTALVRSMTAPASVTLAARVCIPLSVSSGAPDLSVGFRESSTGKMLLFCILNQNGTPSARFLKYSSPTASPTADGNQNRFFAPQPFWIKLEDDNSNLKVSVSHDGENWSQILSESRTAYMAGGPDQFVFGANNFGNNWDTLCTLVAWAEG